MSVVLGMPEAEYHAHKALSASGAKKLLKSARAFREWKDKPQKPKREFDLGSAVHAKVLGVGYPIKVLDFDNFRKVAAQVARDEAREEGLIPILRDQAKELDEASEAVLAHQGVRLLFEQEGDPEASAFVKDPETGIDLRCRFDYLPKPGNRPVCVELKTTGHEDGADAEAFSKAVANFGYDVAEAFYLYILSLIGTHPDAEMEFVVVELFPPFNVGTYSLDEDFKAMGKRMAQYARLLYMRCLERDEWPGYPVETRRLKPPMFHVYNFQDKYA